MIPKKKVLFDSAYLCVLNLPRVAEVYSGTCLYIDVLQHNQTVYPPSENRIYPDYQVLSVHIIPRILKGQVHKLRKLFFLDKSVPEYCKTYLVMSVVLSRIHWRTSEFRNLVMGL